MCSFLSISCNSIFYYLVFILIITVYTPCKLSWILLKKGKKMQYNLPSPKTPPTPKTTPTTPKITLTFILTSTRFAHYRKRHDMPVRPELPKRHLRILQSRYRNYRSLLSTADAVMLLRAIIVYVHS